uniref:Major facilitator superfamily (MFS) profile domain-containing protein n=1 Tax=Meloidogyne enterolobii TaxID=390850 RepID=A0A6V7W5W7_MELEN|nr:unnamed protein product [Meloidogyne enterolobii]
MTSDQQNGKSPFLPRTTMDNEENKNNTNKFRRTNINSLCSFNFNRFHYCVLLCWLFGIFFATQMIFSVFSNYIPKWKCLLNNTSNFARNCTIYQQCPENLIQFEENIPFHSAAMEFGWICGANAYNRALFSQIQFAGVLIGTLTFGAISDAFGRKPVSIFALTVGIASMFATAFAPNWHFLFACRFILGLCIGGDLVVVYTFVMEQLLPSQRMAIRGFFNWGVARLIFTLICMFFPDWRSSSIACAIFSMPALIIIIFLMPESPTWLHSKGRLEQMRINERKIARLAGLPPTIKLPEHEKLSPNENSFWNLIKDKTLLRRVSVLWVMFTAAISGYSIDLNSSNISGDLFLNQSLLSSICAISKICLVIVDTIFPRFSRRNLHQGAQFVVIISASLLVLFVLYDHDGIGILLANLIGITFIELTWDACYLCAVESVPTSLRASSVGSCSLIARIGTLIAPVLVFLNTRWPASVYLIIVLIGSINLLISWLFLIETKGINLDSVHLHEDNKQYEFIGNEEMKNLKIEENKK